MLKQTLLLPVDRQLAACVSALLSPRGGPTLNSLLPSEGGGGGVFTAGPRDTGNGGNAIVGSAPFPPTAPISKAAAPPWNESLDGM